MLFRAMNVQYKEAYTLFMSTLRTTYQTGAALTAIGTVSGVYGFLADKPLMYVAASSGILTGSVLIGVSYHTKKSFCKEHAELRQTLEDLTQ